MIKQVKHRIYEKNIKLEINEAAKKLIIKKGTDAKYGARPLRRAIQNMIEDKLAEEIIEGNLKSGDTAIIIAEGDDVEIKVV